MPLKTTNVGILDDVFLFRMGLKSFLSEQININVVIHTSNVLELYEKLKYYPVQVLLMDLSSPHQDMEDVVRILQKEYPEINIIVLSMFTDMNLVSSLLDCGIYAYILKKDNPEELLNAITSASESRIYSNKLLTEALYLNRQKKRRNNDPANTFSLNEREKQILLLLWEEKSNKEIAEQLFLSVRSIEKIRQDMKEKLNIRSTVGLMKYAINQRIIAANPRTSRLTG